MLLVKLRSEVRVGGVLRRVESMDLSVLAGRRKVGTLEKVALEWWRTWWF